ncbi:hypothetical protein AAHA92_09196 [Salvia divinorum]|uniref:Uncharacterized protein n=1 Tax=Salvia divinorum TaxID=28513 RepID=A0ABD1HS16_SALDI
MWGVGRGTSLSTFLSITFRLGNRLIGLQLLLLTCSTSSISVIYSQRSWIRRFGVSVSSELSGGIVMRY